MIVCEYECVYVNEYICMCVYIYAHVNMYAAHRDMHTTTYSYVLRTYLHRHIHTHSTHSTQAHSTDITQ